MRVEISGYNRNSEIATGVGSKRPKLSLKYNTNKLPKSLIIPNNVYQDIPPKNHPVLGRPATVIASSGNRGINSPPINTTPYANIKILPYNQPRKRCVDLEVI